MGADQIERYDAPVSEVRAIGVVVHDTDDTPARASVARSALRRSHYLQPQSIHSRDAVMPGCLPLLHVCQNTVATREPLLADR